MLVTKSLAYAVTQASIKLKYQKLMNILQEEFALRGYFFGGPQEKPAALSDALFRGVSKAFITRNVASEYIGFSEAMENCIKEKIQDGEAAWWVQSILAELEARGVVLTQTEPSDDDAVYDISAYALDVASNLLSKIYGILLRVLEDGLAQHGYFLRTKLEVSKTLPVNVLEAVGKSVLKARALYQSPDKCESTLIELIESEWSKQGAALAWSHRLVMALKEHGVVVTTEKPVEGESLPDLESLASAISLEINSSYKRNIIVAASDNIEGLGYHFSELSEMPKRELDDLKESFAKRGYSIDSQAKIQTIVPYDVLSQVGQRILVEGFLYLSPKADGKSIAATILDGQQTGKDRIAASRLFRALSECGVVVISDVAPPIQTAS